MFVDLYLTIIYLLCNFRCLRFIYFQKSPRWGFSDSMRTLAVEGFYYSGKFFVVCLMARRAYRELNLCASFITEYFTISASSSSSAVKYFRVMLLRNGDTQVTPSGDERSVVTWLEVVGGGWTLWDNGLCGWVKMSSVSFNVYG